ncbi:MAG: 6-bladed beta-propeller [Lachnospiraceae bacterium]|nr:6-bladed beta-propeller [Lachnospiraceae bacterium]
MKFINFGALSLTLILFGCTHRNASESDIAILNEIDVTQVDDKAFISSVIDTVEYLPLHGSIEHPIGRVDDMQINDKGFFILDQRRKIIHVYDSQGRWLYDLAAIGNGKGEYKEIACFAVTDDEIWVVDNFAKLVNKYSINDGAFIGSMKTPFPITGIRMLYNGDLLLAQLSVRGAVVPDEYQKMRLYVADSDLKIKKAFLPFGEHRDIFMVPQAFKDGDSTIIYSSYGFNGYTVIDAVDGSVSGNVAIKTAKPYDERKFGNKKISISKVADIVDHEGLQPVTSTPICTERFSIFTVKKTNIGNTYLYDRSKGTIYQNSSEDYHNLMGQPHAAKNGRFYLVRNSDFLDEQLEHGFNKPDAVSDSILRNEGSAILIYTMK